LNRLLRLTLCLAGGVLGCHSARITAKEEPVELDQHCVFEKLAPACRTLGGYYETGRFVPRDLTKAAFFYERGCRLGDDRLCVTLGEEYARGERIRKDGAFAVELFQIACNGPGGRESTYSGCTHLGVQYLNGEGVEKNESRAASLFEGACSGGFLEGCYWRAVVLEKGQGVAKDPAASSPLYDRACSGKVAQACTARAAQLRMAGQPEAAAEKFRQGCTAGDPSACQAVGEPAARAETKSNPPDAPFAAQVPANDQRSCEQGVASACVTLVQLLQQTQTGADNPQTMAALEKSCDQKVAGVCSGLGRIFLEGMGTTRDRARAAAFFQKGCDAGSAASCTNLGVLYEQGEGVPKKVASAAKLYQQSCDAGDGAGCHNLGTLLLAGKGLAKQPEKALPLFKKACDSKLGLACYQLGWMYQHGDTVPKDSARAMELYRAGCEQGAQKACAAASSR